MQDYFDCLLEIAFHENGSLRSSESDVIRKSLEKICVNVQFVMRQALFSTWSDPGRVFGAATRISVVIGKMEAKFQEKRVRRDYREIHVHFSKILGYVVQRLENDKREEFVAKNPGVRKVFSVL